MTSVLNESEILKEIVVNLRNANIFSISQRGVTTQTDTGNFATPTGTLTIARSDVKNIRYVKMGTITFLYFGTDYLVNYDATGTCVITFSTNQTGDWTVVYDYGTDKIYPDYPRNDISVNSFPRIGVDFVDLSSEIGGMGNVNLNRYDISIAVYAVSKADVRSYSRLVRTWIIANQNTMFYLRTIKPTLMGPILIGSFENFKDRIFQRNIDFNSLMNLEVN